MALDIVQKLFLNRSKSIKYYPLPSELSYV